MHSVLVCHNTQFLLLLNVKEYFVSLTSLNFVSWSEILQLLLEECCVSVRAGCIWL
jgi:hypothetical protein